MPETTIVEWIWPVILIGLGLVLLVAELFIPTGGIFFVLSVAALVVGVAMTLAIGSTAFLVTLIVVLVGAPVLFGLAFYYWPKTSVGKRFFLAGPDEDATLASTPVNLELEQLRGRYGKTLSALRPAGVTDFDGRRVDTITEGMMIEPGQWVRCIDVQAGKVIVRQVDRPPDLGNLETTDFH
jgi:membrane-bound serine protease (ClpP class)